MGCRGALLCASIAHSPKTRLYVKRHESGVIPVIAGAAAFAGGGVSPLQDHNRITTGSQKTHPQGARRVAELGLRPRL